jgi:hypothetical protein
MTRLCSTHCHKYTAFTSHYQCPRLLFSLILQNTIATIVLNSVAISAGAITAAGLALPYWLR